MQLFTQTAHLSAPREVAGKRTQLARARQKWKSEARHPSRHEHTWCEGEGAVCCGFCSLSGKRSEDDSFTHRCQRFSKTWVNSSFAKLPPSFLPCRKGWERRRKFQTTSYQNQNSGCHIPRTFLACRGITQQRKGCDKKHHRLCGDVAEKCLAAHSV